MEVPDEGYFSKIHGQKFTEDNYPAGTGGLDVLSVTRFARVPRYSDSRWYVSRNAVLLPEAGTDLENWESESMDVVDDSVKKFHILGFAYEYDVVKNVKLVLEFYPETKHIAFISDNSYGGVSLQALVKKEMKEEFPDLDLILLDGRKHTVYSMTDEIAKLPKETAILLGTWRVDKNDGYFMRNATYSMMMTNPTLPAFTITSIGMGYWATGGVYRNIGRSGKI